ncbi:MAG: enoyl-CoA hydratase/isomerase family protein [Bacteriovoracaceae bacterium]|jgi:methylglutaconyl-CoA hydratase|nr:enoyl-CoA hydratase/isomerase family protein [Bacteriovoracaceae bacterium]
MSDSYLVNLDERGVLTISLNRPKIHNAFDDELINSLTEYINDLEQNNKVRLIVLSGEGKSFCAGADLNWMKRMKDYSTDENYADSLSLAGLFHAINKFKGPVIGKVHGAALGGGSGLVAVCDYVLAKEKTIFGFTEVILGLAPAVISPFVMAKIGESNARAYFLSGEKFGTKQAKEMGLIHHVSLERYFHQDVEDVVSKFLKAGPLAQRKVKELIFGVQEFSLQSESMVTDYTCKTISGIRTSEEGQEGMTALLEKRKPNWQNKDT